MLKKQFKKIKKNIKIIKVKNITEGENSASLKVININIKITDPFKVRKKSSIKIRYLVIKYFTDYVRIAKWLEL